MAAFGTPLTLVKRASGRFIGVDNSAEAVSLYQLKLTELHLPAAHTILYDASAAAVATFRRSGAFNLGKAGQTITCDGDLSVAGTLTVSGDKLKVDATLNIVDNLIVCHSGPSAVADGGLLVERYYTDWGSADASGTAQAGASLTITLANAASAVDDAYNDWAIAITANTGAGQYRTITDYNGTTKVATVDVAWTTNPANDSTYALHETPDRFVGLIWDQSAGKFILGRTHKDPGQSNVAFEDHVNLQLGALTSDDGVTIAAGGCTITAGGLDINGGGSDFNAGGLTNVGAVSGVTTLAGSGAISGFTSLALSAGISGVTTLAGSGAISGFTSLALSAGVSGVTTLAGTGAISGFTSLALSAGISGVTTFAASGDVDLTATGGGTGDPDLSVAGYAKFLGAVEVDGALQQDGAATFNGTVALAGASAIVSAGFARLNDGIQLRIGSDDDGLAYYDSGQGKVYLKGAARSTAGQAGVQCEVSAGAGGVGAGSTAGGAGGALYFQAANGGGGAPGDSGGAANGGLINITAGAGGAGNASGTSTSPSSGGAISVTSGAGGAGNAVCVGGAAGALSLRGGAGGAGADAATDTAGGAGGAVSLEGGSGGTGFGDADGPAGGNVTVDAGSGGQALGAGDSGAAGTISIGANTASALAIGRAAVTTTINGAVSLSKAGGSTGSPDFAVAGYAKFAQAAEFDAAAQFDAGATITASGLNLSASGLTNAGAVSGVTTLAGSGAISGFTSLALSAGISGVTTLAGSGAISGFTSLALSAGISGVTTLAGTGAISGFTSLALSAGISGVTTLAGTGAISGFTSLALSAALTGVTSITMAGALSGVTTLAASGVVDFDGDVKIARGKDVSVDGYTPAAGLAAGEGAYFSAANTIAQCNSSDGGNGEKLAGVYNGTGLVSFGNVQVKKAASEAWAIGDRIYLRDDGDGFTKTAPSADDKWQIPVGYYYGAAIAADASSTARISLLMEARYQN